MRWVLSLLLSALTIHGRESLIDSLKHDVKIITPKNFDGSIAKYRDRYPAAILYYKHNKASKSFINNEWDGVAKTLKGMVHIGGVDCSEYSAFCKHEDATSGDKDYVVRFYPPLPMPARMYDGPLTKQTLTAQLTKLIPPAKIDLVGDESEMARFVGNHPSIPKVILFTDKTKASPLFNAIAHSLSDRMNFALVSGPATGPLQTRFKVKKLPALMLKKGDLTVSVKGTTVYRGEMKFHDIFEWLNIHSETFVKGGGFITSKEPEPQNLTETRPWLTQRIPEMMKGSHNDICFKKSKGLCAVYLIEGNELPEDAKNMLEGLSEQFSADRKLGFHWSWLNVGRETNFAKLLKLTEGDSPRTLPSLVVFNPHKRLRFSKLPVEEAATRENIVRFLEKIENGDGRFTVIKGNKVPAFEKRVTPPVPAETGAPEKQEL